MNASKRQSNFEWLRILAMGMIITLHYFFKGGITAMPLQKFTSDSVVAWLIVSACLCAVNVYVLISGYFLVDAEFKAGRLTGLLIQVLEYGLIVLAVMFAAGLAAPSELSLYDVFGYVFPIGTEEYWFVTAYFMTYLLAPVLSKGARVLDQKTLGLVLGGLILFECIEKSVLPFLLPGDKYGYDVIWFMTLFLTAAYVRLYGIPFLEDHVLASVALYAGSAALTFAIGLGCSYAGEALGSGVLTHYADVTSHYNFALVFAASVGLFYVFKNLRFNEDGLPARAARMLGHLTLGVYLLHEHPAVRDRWPNWLEVRADRTTGRMLIHWLGCLVVIYAAGLLAEYLRNYVHGLVAKAGSLHKK